MSFTTISNLNALYQLFLKEYQLADEKLCRIKYFAEKLNNIVQNADSSVDEMLFSEFNGLLIDMTDILMKLNIQIESHPFANKVESPNECTAISVMNFEENDLSQFSYSRADFSKYKVSTIGACSVSHVSGNGCFFMIDKEDGNYLKVLALQTLKEQCKINNDIPKEGQVFGVIMDDNYLFRAVRKNGIVQLQKDTMTIFLIDVGEVIDIKISKYPFLQLPYNYESVPAQALHCKLVGTYIKAYEAANYLEQHLYTNQFYKVHIIENELLHVSLSSTKWVEINNYAKITNPFKLEMLAKSNLDSKNFRQYPVPDATSTNCGSYSNSNYSFDGYQPREINILEEVTNDLSLYVPRPKPDRITKDTFTIEQQRQLFEEPLGTDDAMVAVMGYNPTDDARLCPHFDPKIDACFKGARCKLLHLPKLQGGWTRDKAATKTQIIPTLDLPRIGQEFQIIPTHIVSVGKIYGHILNQKSNNLMGTLEDLAMQIYNSKSLLKPLDHLPVISEYVLALYEDGNFYRARIQETINDQSFKVIYVDYGNAEIVALEDMRQWDNKFDYLPVQAVLMYIVNVDPRSNCDTQSVESLKQMILNKKVTAEVQDNSPDLHVNIFDNEGFDIGDMMIVQNMAKRKTFNGKMEGTIPG